MAITKPPSATAFQATPSHPRGGDRRFERLRAILKRLLAGLQTEILLSLTFILVVAMGLTGFIVSRIWKQDMLRYKTAEGLALIGRLQIAMDNLHAPTSPPQEAHIIEHLEKSIRWMAQEALPGPIVIAGKDGALWRGKRSLLNPEALTLLRTTVLKRTERPFRVEKREGVLLFMAPLFLGEEAIAVAQVPIRLDDALASLTRSQQLVWFYIGLNVLVLLVFGTYLLSRVVVRPIRRLMKTAEHFEGASEPSFRPEKTHNEIAHLARALNQMLKRLEDNKARMADQIASLKQANQELKEAREVVLRSEKLSSLGRLTAGVAHEVGNPLGAILGYTELLKPSVLDNEEARDYLSRIEEEISRIDTIVRDLLDFSRPADEDSVPVDVNGVVSSAVSLFTMQQKTASGVVLKTDLAPDVDLVWANSARLKQVLVNLLFNASDAVGAKGNIVVSTGRTAGVSGSEAPPQKDVEIMVADDGEGIPAPQRDKIFDPFYTTKPPGKGTGLGLSVSLRIVESFGGTLQVQSKEGKGAVFTVTLKSFSKNIETGSAA